jgi:hypothetical protein
MSFIDYPEGWFVLSKDYHFYRTYHRGYGKLLWPGDYSEIVRQIRKGDAVLVKRDERRGTSLWKVRIKNRMRRGRERIIVWFDDGRKTLISAFPRWRLSPSPNKINEAELSPLIAS